MRAATEVIVTEEICTRDVGVDLALFTEALKYSGQTPKSKHEEPTAALKAV